MKKHLLAAAALLVIGAGCDAPAAKIANFEECAAAGNPVMESFPRQCRAGGQTFVEQVDAAEPPCCEGGVETAPASEYGKPVTLEDGGSTVFPDGLQVTLLAVNDSRCSEGVQCVWAGELSPVLSVLLLDEGAAPVEVTLGTTTRKEAQALGRTFKIEATTEDIATILVTKDVTR